jgi:rhamnosyltransferase
MITTNYKVSVLIPTLNAGNQWANVLAAIQTQIFPQPIRKIVIDSGSRDNTVSLALSAGFEVIEISKKEFNHGATRQALVNRAPDTDICVFLTQDAILASTDSIANLVAAFDDGDVGMAYGRQLPHKHARALETHARLFNYPAQSIVKSLGDKDRLGFKVFFCSNSFCAYRREALMSVGGFPSDSIMGEDAITAAKMLLAGLKVAYVADSAVYHSHTYSLKEEYKRYFDTRVFHEQNKWLIEKYGKPTGEGLKFINSELKYALKHDLKSIFKSVSSVGAKWLGYQSGKYYKTIRPAILKKVSMHKFYWE